jgi:hypothetical protein
MPRRGVYAVATVLACALAVGARAAESEENAPSPATAPSGNWLTRWFTPSKPAVPKKTGEKPAKVEDSAQHKVVSRAAAAAERAQEENALLRRQAVCNKLRTIAAQTNDEELRRKADELDDRAWSLYLRRIAHLPAGGGRDTPGDTPGDHRRPASSSGAQVSPSAHHAPAREEMP